MSYSHILFETDEAGIALVTVNRPEKLNALSGAVVVELASAFEQIAGDPLIRAAIVTGAALGVRGAPVCGARPADVPRTGDLIQAVGSRCKWLPAGRRSRTGHGVHGALRF